MTASKIIGIDLGGTSIKFGILTLDGEVQDKWSIPTNIIVPVTNFLGTLFILCFINTSIRPVFSAIHATSIVTSTSPNGANDWKFETMLPKNILSCSLVNKFIAIIFSPVDFWCNFIFNFIIN